MIEVDANQYTGVAKVYAVGDCVGGNLATIGQSQAVRAVRWCFGAKTHSLQDKAVKPFGVWTIPELAWAGLNEQEAAKLGGREIGSVRVEYGATVRGIVSSEKGFLKLIFDRSDGKVLGVHIFGSNACDLINYGAEVTEDGDTIFDMLHFVFPAVTYHQLYHMAATEAKIRLQGVRSISAATAWNRVRVELQKIASCSQDGWSVEDTLCAAFKLFDRDGSGFITSEDLQDALSNLGLRFTPAEVDEMVAEVDVSGDGQVDYQEFLKVCNR